MASQIHPFGPCQPFGPLEVAGDGRVDPGRHHHRERLHVHRQDAEHAHPAERVEGGDARRELRHPRYATPGVITVFAPRPAAAWVKASSIRASGNFAPTSRFTPSFGSSASARRKAVPRP